MPTRFLAPALTAAALVLGATASQAADFTLAGDIVYNTDVVEIGFSLGADSAGVRLWTDSWNGGANFDPVTALWAWSGHQYTLVAEVDDDDTIAAGQGYFDSGLAFASLAAGRYIYTVAASPNYHAGGALDDGFVFDGSTPVRIADWQQPGSNPNFPDQKGTFWRVNLSNVDQAAVVPEPSTWWLLSAGLGALGWVGARRSRSAADPR